MMCNIRPTSSAQARQITRHFQTQNIILKLKNCVSTRPLRSSQTSSDGRKLACYFSNRQKFWKQEQHFLRYFLDQISRLLQLRADEDENQLDNLRSGWLKWRVIWQTRADEDRPTVAHRDYLCGIHCMNNEDKEEWLLTSCRSSMRPHKHQKASTSSSIMMSIGDRRSLIPCTYPSNTNRYLQKN